MIFSLKRKLPYFVIALFFLAFSANAQYSINASDLLARSALSFSPRSGSFEEGSTFQVPILVDTKNRSINGIEVRISFDKNKLSIVNPISGNSIIGVWAEPPKYDNTQGTASYVGVIPGGITTDSGLVGTITFKAKVSGRAVVTINPLSKVLLNDGLGTVTILDYGRAEYTIFPKAPEGVQVFSETHPIQSDWYNNNTAVISWLKDEGVEGFSFELDNRPNTIPDNSIDTIDTTTSFDLNEGLWYFHIKASKSGMWGTTGHFLIRIDTTPPAEFKPQTDYLVAAIILTERTLVSFFTTDNLSGLDHYEVGIIDKNQPLTESPVFVEANSPFQVPLVEDGSLQVIVRAVDKAGNIRDASVDVRAPFVFEKFFDDYMLYILAGIILLGLVMLILHYLVGHHILRHLRRGMQIAKREEMQEEIQESQVKPVYPAPEDNNLNHPPQV